MQLIQAIRIIPAYAGSTVRSANCTWSTRDHPRIRGEHLAGLGRVIGGVGSSPHTRGAPGVLVVQEFKRGIIPAYAGSTCAAGPPSSAPSDHPRIRGEHTWKSLQYQGSPP